MLHGRRILDGLLLLPRDQGGKSSVSDDPTHSTEKLTQHVSQITLEEVEVVFGSGAGTYVRQALGRRSSVHERNDSDSSIEGNAVTYNAVPKLAKKALHADKVEQEIGEVAASDDDVSPRFE